MTIKVVIERGEDGFFVAHCPSLKSCWSQGQIRDEALANLGGARIQVAFRLPHARQDNPNDLVIVCDL